MKLFDEVEDRIATLTALMGKVQALRPEMDHEKDAKGRALSYLNGEICRAEFIRDELRNVLWLTEGAVSLQTHAQE